MTRAHATPAPASPFVASWVAVAVDVPLYTVLGTAFAYAGAQVWEALTDADAEVRATLDATEAAVLATTALIVVVGIAAVAHTVGRWVHTRTGSLPTSAAAGRFALMGGLLGLLPAAAVAALSGEPAAIAFVAIAIVAPCALVAGLTRALLPRVWRSETVFTGFAIAAVISVLLACAVLALLGTAWPLGGAPD
ncbi:hypothetical protein [Demequina silvatica]|uniref:hypothetical protein n=1 Tax=Demequina silvatica TaxID=1638988 RepID=UPI0007833CC6|nr:hypothetical protein [Demequina silvatica]